MVKTFQEMRIFGGPDGCLSFIYNEPEASDLPSSIWYVPVTPLIPVLELSGVHLSLPKMVSSFKARTEISSS